MNFDWLMDPGPTATKDAFVVAVFAGCMIWLYPQQWRVYVLFWLAYFVGRRVWYHYHPYVPQSPPTPGHANETSNSPGV